MEPAGATAVAQTGYFLNSRSKALRASLALLGGAIFGSGTELRGGIEAGEAFRATVTRGEKSVQSFRLSLTAMRTGIGFRHWNRVEGSN